MMKDKLVPIILMAFMSIVVILLSASIIIFLDLRSGYGNTAEKESTQEEYIELYVHSFDRSIVSNVKNSRKFIRFNYAIEVDDVSEAEVLKKNEKMITDIAIKILREKDEDDYANDNIQEVIKSDLRRELEDSLNLERIQNIYITEFVIQ